MDKTYSYFLSWIGSYQGTQVVANNSITQDHKICAIDIEGWAAMIQEERELDAPPTILFFSKINT